MILSIFDYIYYRTYSAYKNMDNMPYMYAIGLVALMQQFNVFTIYFWADTLFGLDLDINKYVAYASFFVFLIPNYIRYTRFKDYKEMDEMWNGETKGKKIKKGGIVLAYVILSVIIFFATAHITGKINRGEL